MLNENIINITWQYWIRVERKKKKVLHTDLTCTNVNTETLFYLLLDYSENSNICMSCVVHDFGWKVTPLSNLETVTTFVSIHFFTSEINNHTSSPFYTFIHFIHYKLLKSHLSSRFGVLHYLDCCVKIWPSSCLKNQQVKSRQVFRFFSFSASLERV